MAFALPPWLDVTPAYFTSALEAGARAGLAVSEQQQRVAQLAEARAERQAALQQRADEQAERQREFEQSRLLDVQRLAQNAQQFQQQVAHQTAQEANQAAQESRLLDYDKGRLAVENRRAALAEKNATVMPTWMPAKEGAPGHFVNRSGTATVPPGSEPLMPTPTPEDLGGGIQVLRVSPQHFQVIGKPGSKLPIESAQEVAWRNADIKANQARKADLLKQGTRADAPDILKLDQTIDENKNTVRDLIKAAGGKSAPAPTSAAVVPTIRTKSERDALPAGAKYIGPDGRIYTKAK